MRYVVVPISHGVEHDPIKDDYASPLIANIKSFLTDEERGYFQPVVINWSKTLYFKASEIFYRCSRGMPKQGLRNLKYLLGGSIIQYQLTKSGGGFYYDLHNQIDDLTEIKMNSCHPCTIIMIGHSLGCQILYDHFFDTKFTEGDKPQGLIMMGSPFNIYSMKFDDWGKLPPYPIRFLKNIFLTNDWIADPMCDHPSKEIGNFVEDIEVPVDWTSPINWLMKLQLIGGLRAHCAYWENIFVAKTIAKTISELINEK